MNATKNSDRIVRARAKVWSGRGATQERFAVSGDGTVRVWDDVAGHYTTCHAMSERSMGCIRRMAQA